MRALVDEIAVIERDRADILLDVIASMTQAPGVDAALQRLAELALRAAGGDRCAILTRESPDNDRLVPAAAATRIGDPIDQWQRFRDMDAVDIGENFERRILLRTEQIIAIEDAASSPIIPQRWHREWGSRSVVLAPLRLNEDVYGILAIDHVQRAHRFTEDELELLRSIASAASLALRDAELIEQVRQRAVIEQQLAECTALLLSGGSTRDVLASLADAFHVLLPETSFSINLVSADRRSFRTVAWRGTEPVRDQFALDELPLEDIETVRRTWRDDPHQPIEIDELWRLPRWHQLLPGGLDVGLLVPLTTEGTVIGWIAAGRAGRPFSPDEVRVARVFAGHAAISVHQAHLRDSAEARLNVIDALFLLGERAGRLSDPKQLVRALNGELTAALGLRCTRLAIEREPLARTLRLPIATADERALLRGWRADPSPSVQPTGLAVPVHIGGRAAGILWFETVEPPDPMTVSLATAIAAAIGEVAFKARLRARSEQRAVDLALAKERERIAEDLHDTVGQIFYSIGLRVHDAAMRVTDPALREALLTLRSHAAAGMHEVRAAVYAQSVLSNDRAGLSANVREIARRFALTTGVEVDVRVADGLGRIPKDVSQSLGRVVHEIFVNVERHARARYVTLALERTGDELHLLVRDDGVGLAQRDEGGWRESAHFGMRSMERTIQRLGGSFTVQHAKPIGLEIRIRVPLRVER